MARDSCAASAAHPRLCRAGALCGQDVNASKLSLAPPDLVRDALGSTALYLKRHLARRAQAQLGLPRSDRDAALGSAHVLRVPYSEGCAARGQPDAEAWLASTPSDHHAIAGASASVPALPKHSSAVMLRHRQRLQPGGGPAQQPELKHIPRGWPDGDVAS